MKAHILQHVPFEGIASIEAWLTAQGAAIEYTRFYEEWSLPELEGLDLVIAMGGPMSVNDEAELPWLVDEKRFLRAAIERGVALLGICLGAQLIASALGARVYQGPQREIGWFDIEAEAGPADRFRFPGKATVFHWHGETFDLPEGTARLASSAACKNQAFQCGRNVIGLQFHLETTPASMEAIVANCRHELVESDYVQSEAAIRAASPAMFTQINGLMAEVLSYLVRPKRGV